MRFSGMHLLHVIVSHMLKLVLSKFAAWNIIFNYLLCIYKFTLIRMGKGNANAQKSNNKIQNNVFIQIYHLNISKFYLCKHTIYLNLLIYIQFGYVKNCLAIFEHARKYIHFRHVKKRKDIYI